MAEDQDKKGAHKTSILIVDDSVQFARVLTKMLEGGFGYHDITVLNDINQAYELLAQGDKKFDLLFLDYRFPNGQTGGELLTRLQTENLGTHKISFLITSEPSSENLKQALSAGALGVIAKPFDRDELRRQLEKAQHKLEAETEDSF